MKQTTHATLLRFLARMPDELQIEVIEKVFSYFYLLKEHNAQKLNRSERFHKSLLHILNEYHQRLSIGSSKKHSRELRSLEEKSELQEKLITTSSPRRAKKRSKILNQYSASIYHFHEIEHRSFAWISKYLSKYKKLKIDTTYLSKLYPQIVEKVTLLKAEQQLFTSKCEESPL